MCELKYFLTYKVELVSDAYSITPSGFTSGEPSVTGILDYIFLRSFRLDLKLKLKLLKNKKAHTFINLMRQTFTTIGRAML